MTDYTTYIKMAQVFANTTFLEVYLFDFAERRLVFASPTILKHRKIQTKKVSGEECRMDIDKVLPMNQDEQTALRDSGYGPQCGSAEIQRVESR